MRFDDRAERGNDSMTTETMNVKELVAMRNTLAISQKELYVAAVTNINMRNRELLKCDFGMTLVKNCAWDAADTIVNRFFNTADYYISPQQLYERIVRFSYDDNIDPLANNAAIRKMLYENQNNADILYDIALQSEKAGQYLFSEERKSDPIEKKTKQYRQDRMNSTGLVDDITGNQGSFYTRTKNGKEETVSNLQADHIQARDSIKYDARYIDQSRLDDMKEFYYSDNNFWLIHASANSSKGAVRVYKTDNGVVFLQNTEFKKGVETGKYTLENDITWKATAEQLTEATVQMWEKETTSGKKTETLRNEQYLDENNRVRPEVREKLLKTYRAAINEESIRMILPYYEENENGERELKMPWIDYEEVAYDATEVARKTLKKIIVGQVIYYVLPPMVYETKTIVAKKGMTLDRFFSEIKQSGKRIVQYIKSKLGKIFMNIASNTFNKFLKTFFDILIEAVRETVKRLLKIIKQLVLSLVNCIRVIASKNSTASEKADAVTKTLAVSISTIVLEIIFEWAEDQFGLPDIIMEPLQIIVTILTTNLIMLVLQKADLFDVQYGLLVANIERVFDEENQMYMEQSAILQKEQKEKMDTHIANLKQQIAEIQDSISTLNLYEDDATDNLNKINTMFDMGIDFDKEWSDYISAPCGGI